MPDFERKFCSIPGLETRSSLELTTQMLESEAIYLLARCRTLAKNLTSINLLLELTQADREALAGFENVRRSGYPYGKLKQLASFAGLDGGDLGMLNWYCNGLSASKAESLSV
jgi:hypothetical protein